MLRGASHKNIILHGNIEFPLEDNESIQVTLKYGIMSITRKDYRCLNMVSKTLLLTTTILLL